MTYQDRIAARLAEIETELAALTAAIAAQGGVQIWAECLRVLKPGGHLLAFAGTRTQAPVSGVSV